MNDNGHVWTDEERKRARTNAAARNLAYSMAQTIELATSYYPEVIGRALREAYGVQALLHLWESVEQRSKGVLEQAEAARKVALQTRELMEEVIDQLDGIEERLSELEYRSERLERRA